MKSVQIHNLSKFEKREKNREREYPCPKGVYSAMTTVETLKCVIDFVVEGKQFCFSITAVDTKEDEPSESGDDSPSHIPRFDLNTQLEISWLDGERTVLIVSICDGHNKDEEYGHTYTKIVDKNMFELSEKLDISNVLALKFLVFCLGFPTMFNFLMDTYVEVCVDHIEYQLNDEIYRKKWPKEDKVVFSYEDEKWKYLHQWESEILGSK